MTNCCVTCSIAANDQIEIKVYSFSVAFIYTFLILRCFLNLFQFTFESKREKNNMSRG